LINILIIIAHHYIYIEAAVDSNPPPSEGQNQEQEHELNRFTQHAKTTTNKPRLKHWGIYIQAYLKLWN